MTTDDIDDQSMLVPMLMMAGIVVFILYSCCGPAPDPDKERPQSESSTRKLMRED